METALYKNKFIIIITFKEDMKEMGVIWRMEPAGSQVTVKDGDFSSPDAPRGTGGPK